MAGSIQRLAGLTPEADALEVGCGLARVARPLVSYFTSGSYTGIDVAIESVEWCREAYRDHPAFSFVHADLFNTRYNPDGPGRPESYRFPFESESFDVVFSASLFTHLLIDATANYLGEMARVLKPGGTTWNTFLLLDEGMSDEALRSGTWNRWQMPFRVESGRIANERVPEQVVGLEHARVQELHSKHNLEITKTVLANWSGTRPQIEFVGQDIVVARKT